MRRIMVLAVLSTATAMTPWLAFGQNAATRNVPAPPQPKGRLIEKNATAPAQGKGAVNDQLFAMAVAESNLAEIAAAQIALERSQNEEVKKFARQMIADHTKADQQLKQLAATKQIALPRTLGVTCQAEANVLNGLQGTDFDTCYAKQQIAAHMCAVGLFKAESERGRDNDIKGFATQTLPKLQEHLKMAHQLPGAHDRAAGTSKDAGK